MFHLLILKKCWLTMLFLPSQGSFSHPQRRDGAEILTTGCSCHTCPEKPCNFCIVSEIQLFPKCQPPVNVISDINPCFPPSSIKTLLSLFLFQKRQHWGPSTPLGWQGHGEPGNKGEALLRGSSEQQAVPQLPEPAQRGLMAEHLWLLHHPLPARTDGSRPAPTRSGLLLSASLRGSSGERDRLQSEHGEGREERRGRREDIPASRRS